MKSLFKVCGFICLLIILNTCKKDKDQVSNSSTDYKIYDKGEGLIGSGGGRITLNDPISPINGTSVDIPQGALSSNIKISILLDNSIRPSGKTLVDIINFQPDGLTFNKPISITIPLKNISNPKLFYFLPDSDAIEQVYITESNITMGYIKAEINHFSYYFVADDVYGTFDAFLYKTATGLKANVKFGGIHDNQITLEWVPVKTFFFLTSGFSSVKEIIDNCVGGNWGTESDVFHTHFSISLKEGAFPFPSTLKTISYEIRRIGTSQSNLSVRIKQISPTNKIVYESGPQDSETREAFFNGKALVFDFGIQPIIGKNYYLELTWYFAEDPLLETKISKKYTLYTFNKYPAWTVSSCLTDDPDKNGNLIEDSYDAPANQPPLQPNTPIPANKATGVSTSPTLSWLCIDPEEDPLTYDVFFGTSINPTTQIGTNLTTASIIQNGLDQGITYYWKVTAKDSHSNSTNSPLWNFSTSSSTTLTANFTASQNNITVGSTVIFTDQSTGTPTSWSWDFGDEVYSSNQNPSHTYSTAGIFTVTLTVTNSLGSETEEKTNYIIVNPVSGESGIIFNPNLTYGTVSDIDGNVYKTIQIGNQVWMAENLKTIKYNDGSAIPNITDDATWSVLTTGAYSDYSITPVNSTTYGTLYNWYTVDNNVATKMASNGGKNVCPRDWHVPSDAEWTALTTYLGGEIIAGDKLKETGTTHWIAENTGATNETGFTALPGGYRNSVGSFDNDIFGFFGMWWSITEGTSTWAYYRDMGYNTSYITWNLGDKQYGFSVRCIKDN